MKEKANNAKNYKEKQKIMGDIYTEFYLKNFNILIEKYNEICK